MSRTNGGIFGTYMYHLNSGCLYGVWQDIPCQLRNYSSTEIWLLRIHADCVDTDMWRHALLSCPMSASVWALAPEELVHHMVERQEDRPKNWLFALHEILDANAFVQMIVTLWAILGARRKAIYEDIFQSPLSTHGFITRYLTEL